MVRMASGQSHFRRMILTLAVCIGMKGLWFKLGDYLSAETILSLRHKAEKPSSKLSIRQRPKTKVLFRTAERSVKNSSIRDV